MLYSVHFLRFVAAMAVVVHHLLDMHGAHSVALGAGGVDLFFVISGVVIGLTPPEMSAKRFLLRRLIRIVPLYWLATLTVAIFVMQFGPAPPTETILRSLFMVPADLTGWVPLYGPAWTLLFELLFYATFGLFLGLAPCHVAILTAAALVPIAFLVPSPGSQSPFVAHAGMVLEFIIGLGISQAIRMGLTVRRDIGAVLIAAALAWFAYHWDGGHSRVIAWGFPSMLLLTGALAFESSPILRRPICVLGGDASYAIYLFHLTIIQAIGVMFFRLGAAQVDHPAINCAGVLIAAPIVAAWIFVVIERPILAGLRSLLLGPSRLTTAFV